MVFDIDDGLAGRPIALKKSRHGPMFFLKQDLYVGRSLDLYGEFSELEGHLFSQFLRQGMSVVEVGANIGAHTVSMAQMVGPTGKVYAYEPQRVIFQILCANLAVNCLYNVYTEQSAVGARKGTLKVPPLDYAAVNNFGGLSLLDSSFGEAVPVIPLDSENIPEVHLLKVDVEGMEASVLKGAEKLIAKHKPVLYLENDRREKSSHLIGKILELGYKIWWHTPPLFNPNNFNGVSQNVFPGIVSINLLCVPAESTLTVEGFKPVLSTDDWFQ